MAQVWVVYPEPAGSDASLSHEMFMGEDRKKTLGFVNFELFYFGITFPINLCQIRYKVLMVFHSNFLFYYNRRGRRKLRHVIIFSLYFILNVCGNN